MKLDIQSEFDNKLLDRKEIKAEVSFDGATPNKKDIKAQIGGKVGADPALIVLRQVVNEFGIRRVNVTAHIYGNADMLKKNEPYHILVREGLAEKKAKKQKKKAAPAKKKQ